MQPRWLQAAVKLEEEEELATARFGCLARTYKWREEDAKDRRFLLLKLKL